MYALGLLMTLTLSLFLSLIYLKTPPNATHLVRAVSRYSARITTRDRQPRLFKKAPAQCALQHFMLGREESSLSPSRSSALIQKGQLSSARRQVVRRLLELREGVYVYRNGQGVRQITS